MSGRLRREGLFGAQQRQRAREHLAHEPFLRVFSHHLRREPRAQPRLKSKVIVARPLR